MMSGNEQMLVGLVSISDRAAQGVYQDQGLPALEEWLRLAISSAWRSEARLIADDRAAIEQTLIDLVDRVGCHLVLTTGGTGPAARDLTPEATLAVADRLMPGFGEEMRRISLHFVPTAILSRQVAVIRRQSLMATSPDNRKPSARRSRDSGPLMAARGSTASLPPSLTASTSLVVPTSRRARRSSRRFGQNRRSDRNLPMALRPLRGCE